MPLDAIRCHWFLCDTPQWPLGRLGTSKLSRLTLSMPDIGYSMVDTRRWLRNTVGVTQLVSEAGRSLGVQFSILNFGGKEEKLI